MTLFRFCRVVVICIFFCAFSALAGLLEHTYVIHATNKITDTKDSLYICKKNRNDEQKECHEFKTNIELSNPIAVATIEKKLFVANYGSIAHMGTSFLLRCELPNFDAYESHCESVVGLASASHITGLAIFSDYLLFIKSNTSKENINFNTLVVCKIPMSGRINECEQQIHLPSLIPNPQPSYNTSMPITIASNVFYISDDAGGTVFECTLPQTVHQMSCQAHTFMEVSKIYPEGFINPTVFNPNVINLMN